MSVVARFAERAAAVIENQRWLDTPGYKLEHGLALTFNLAGSRSRGLQDFLHGRWLGHPLHPVLTDVPVGAWTTAAILDVAGAMSAKSHSYRRAAQLAVGAGVLGGAAAAVSGLIDWQHTQDQPRRSGLIHGVLNLAALGLNAASWRYRSHGRVGAARLASGLGYVLVLGSSYLGGNLVFRHGIGVDHGHKPPAGSHRFVAVLAEADLVEDVPRLVRVDGVDVVLVRHGGQISAVAGLCSHLGAPLEQGWLYRDTLVCPWHGSRFDLQTGCPSTGPATAPLARYETRVTAGHIEVRPVAVHTRPATRSKSRSTAGQPS